MNKLKLISKALPLLKELVDAEALKAFEAQFIATVTLTEKQKADYELAVKTIASAEAIAKAQELRDKKLDERADKIKQSEDLLDSAWEEIRTEKEEKIPALHAKVTERENAVKIREDNVKIREDNNLIASDNVKARENAVTAREDIQNKKDEAAKAYAASLQS